VQTNALIQALACFGASFAYAYGKAFVKLRALSANPDKPDVPGGTDETLAELIARTPTRPAAIYLDLSGQLKDLAVAVLALGELVPLVVWRRVGERQSDSTTIACAWLRCWLQNGLDPLAALHEVLAQHEQELKRLGKTYEFHMYPNAGHGFFYYDRPAYRPEQAVDGWKKVFAFLEKYVSA